MQYCNVLYNTVHICTHFCISWWIFRGVVGVLFIIVVRCCFCDLRRMVPLLCGYVAFRGVWTHNSPFHGRFASTHPADAWGERCCVDVGVGMFSCVVTTPVSSSLHVKGSQCVTVTCHFLLLFRNVLEWRHGPEKARERGVQLYRSDTFGSGSIPWGCPFLIVESPELNACSCQVSVGQNTGLNERLVDEWVIDIGKLGCTALPLSESNHTRSYANKQSMSTSWCFTFPCQVESNLTRMYQDSDERSFHVFHFEMQILVRRWDTVDICRSACEIFCDLLSTHDTEILGMSIAWSSWPPTDQEMIQKSCWSVAGCPMNGGAEKNLPRVDRWKPSGCHRLQFPGPRAPDRFVLVISCHYCILYIYIYCIYDYIWIFDIIWQFDHICTMHNAQYIQVSDRIPSVPISCRQM